MAGVFPAGTVVRHVNPELADWEGVIDLCPRGSKKGQFADYLGEHSYTYVRWTAGTIDDGTRPKPGWTSIEYLVAAE